MVRNFHVDIAVCSCKGIDFKMGITDSNERDAEIKKAFFDSAKRKILAVDNTKFGRQSFVQVSDLETVDMVVTDREPNEEWKERFREEKIELAF